MEKRELTLTAEQYALLEQEGRIAALAQERVDLLLRAILAQHQIHEAMAQPPQLTKEPPVLVVYLSGNGAKP